MCSKASSMRTSGSSTLMSARSCTATCARLERTPKELSNKRLHDQLMQRSSCLRRSQQKVQPEVEWRSVVTASAMSHRWCEASPKIDRVTAATMSRRGARGNPTSVRTGLSTETTRRRVRRTATHKHASTSWRFDLLSSWRLDYPSLSRQDNHGTLGLSRRKAVGGSTSRRDTSHRHEM